MPRILVTGATGNVGREVLRQLRGLPHHVRAMSRNPAAPDAPDLVDTVRGDLSAPETLDAALDGVDAVFLVWTAPLASAAPAIARIAARAPRVVLLTSPHTTPHPFFQQPNALRAVHAGVEELVRASGVSWTILRPGPFALNCVGWWSSQIKAGDVVRWTYADAETAPIHEHDIAAVAVRALTEDGHHAKEYVLTGPESLTERRQVEILGEALGRPLRLEELTRDAGKALMMETMPPAVADMLLDAYGAAVGLRAYVTDTVEQVTGTPARSFARWASDHAHEFLS
jgi:uncharacterized protein YbjT (DUF2867 family)